MWEIDTLTTNRSVRVGIIGTGTGLRTLLPGFRRTGRADVVALAGSTPERCRRWATEHQIEHAAGSVAELCELPLDLICVASPTYLHLEHLRIALATDRNLYVEKPVGRNGAELAQIVAATGDARDRFVAVGYQLRFNPHLRAVRQAIEDGRIGVPRHVLVNQENRRAGIGVADYWRTGSDLGGGARLDIGSHLTDLTRWLLGAEPVEVSSRSGPVAPSGDEASDLFTAILRTTSCVVSMVATTASCSGNHFALTVHGSDGDLRFDVATGAQIARLGGPLRPLVPAAVDQDVESRRARSIFSTSFSYFAEALVDAVVAGANHVPGAATLADAQRTMRVLDAAAESDRLGASVDLGSM